MLLVIIFYVRRMVNISITKDHHVSLFSLHVVLSSEPRIYKVLRCRTSALKYFCMSSMSQTLVGFFFPPNFQWFSCMKTKIE